MKSMFFKNRWIQIVYGALLVVGGALAIVFAVTSVENFKTAISVIAAVCCFVLGVVYIASSFASELKVLFPASLVFGAVCIAIGVVLCINTSLLTDVIVYLVGALLLAYGLIIGLKGAVFAAIKAKVIHVVLYFLLAVVAIVLGVLTFVYCKDSTQTSLIIILSGVGGCIACYGIFEIVLAVKLMIAANKVSSAVKKVVSEQKVESKKIEGRVVDAQIEEKK